MTLISSYLKRQRDRQALLMIICFWGMLAYLLRTNYCSCLLRTLSVTYRNDYIQVTSLSTRQPQRHLDFDRKVQASVHQKPSILMDDVIGASVKGSDKEEPSLSIVTTTSDNERIFLQETRSKYNSYSEESTPKKAKRNLRVKGWTGQINGKNIEAPMQKANGS